MWTEFWIFKIHLAVYKFDLLPEFLDIKIFLSLWFRWLFKSQHPSFQVTKRDVSMVPGYSDNTQTGAEERVQCLRALVTLEDNVRSGPSSYMVAHDHPQLQFQRTWCFFWPPWAQDTHGVLTYTQATHSHKTKVKLKSKIHEFWGADCHLSLCAMAK